ncbi:hypothetical protein [Streptomyces fimbriatus]|uniref:hypothetical protein n=1 Tax=Streptomyces fimbriatus TaxID=68197 RepID=UPI0031E2671A
MSAPAATPTSDRFPAGAPTAGDDPAKAAHEARCVVEVVGGAVQGGVVDKVRRPLDDELAQLLFAGSTGRIT